MFPHHLFEDDRSAEPAISMIRLYEDGLGRYTENVARTVGIQRKLILQYGRTQRFGGMLPG